MRENKLLAMAIASALSIGSTATVQASTLLLIDPTGDGNRTPLQVLDDVLINDGDPAPPPTYAAELFSPTGTGTAIPERTNAPYSSDDVSSNEGHRYRVVYDIDDNLGRIPFNFEITFTLDGGNVTWGNFVDAGLLGASGDVNLRLQGDATNEASDQLPEISKVSGGEDIDNTVTFLVQAEQNPIHTGSVHFEFMFDIDDANILNNAGSFINLTASTDIGDSPSSVKIATSDNGVSVNISPSGANDRKQTKEAAIDVTKAATMFTSETKPSSLGVLLGSLAIQKNTDATVVGTDATSGYDFDGEEATFTIIDGPLCASAADPEVDNLVFLDMNNNDTFEEDTDIPATRVQGNHAEWDLTGDDLQDLYDKTSPSEADIIALVDGETMICEQEVAPTATLQIVYRTGKSIFSGSLFHIKRNGTVCTLYNIPSPPAFDNGVPPKDNLHIRITNRSIQDATLIATLRTMGGEELCRDFELGTVKPNETLHLTQDELVAKANEKVGCEDVATWENRAVLTIGSDAPDGSLQIFGMLRNKMGGPLTNLSLGATGNGCD
jgi:hypothetical protein